MQIIRHPHTTSSLPSAIAIGNFDGVHLGHQEILQRLVETARRQNLVPSVMTFEPHPREFFTPQDAPARLTSLREKLEFFVDHGIEQAYVCRFDQRMAGMTAQDFMQVLLKDALNVQCVLVGEDFRFGLKRQGGVSDLLAAGFALADIPEITYGGSRISSTRVREALDAGDLVVANALLGRRYSVSGRVVHGAKRGRQLGFPTANVHMRHERPALKGVYAVKLDGLNGVANLGWRPTVAGLQKLSLEVHLLDFSGDLYGRHVHVSFLKKLRDEMKFPDFDALKAQIAFDAQAARDYFEHFNED